MSSVFLFGAGASYGSGECDPYPPPLGCDLFLDLQKSGGIAASIAGPLEEMFVTKFEDGMAEFHRQRSEETTRFLREMSLYFVKFSPGPNNLYVNLARAVDLRKKTVVFAATNYDLMIELALARSGYTVSYQGLPLPRGTVSALKIHGSVNFIPDLRGNQLVGVRFHVGSLGANLDSPIHVGNTQEVEEFCRDQDSLSPAIAMFTKGKQILFCPSFLHRQQEAWKVEVERASRIYVIGLAVNPDDDHISGTLSSSRAQLNYVGRDAKQFIEWAKHKVVRISLFWRKRLKNQCLRLSDISIDHLPSFQLDRMKGSGSKTNMTCSWH